MIDHNGQTLHADPTILSPSEPIQTRAATGQHHVYTESFLGKSFAEIWADRTYPDSSGNRYYTVTHYNTKIGLPGDGCSLAKVNTNDYQTLYRSPTNPPLGLQEVNKTYKVDSSHSAQLDVSVTGFYDVYGTKLIYPLIFANNLII